MGVVEEAERVVAEAVVGPKRGRASEAPDCMREDCRSCHLVIWFISLHLFQVVIRL